MRWLVSTRIDDDLFMLGHQDVPVYLLNLGFGEYALIEGGVCVDAERIWQQLIQLIDPQLVRYWFITHKHYDHCGAAAVLVNRLPNVKLIVGESTWAAWQSESCRKVITKLNARICVEDISSSQHCMELHLAPCIRVCPGDTFETRSGVQLRSLPALGHSDDSIVWYQDDKSRLFAADAVGEYDHFSNFWRPLIFEDVDNYIKTLRTLAELKIHQLIPGHGGVAISEDPHRLISGVLSDCLKFLEQCKSVDEIGLESQSRRLHDMWFEASQRFVSSELHLSSMKCMLGAIYENNRELI